MNESKLKQDYRNINKKCIEEIEKLKDSSEQICNESIKEYLKDIEYNYYNNLCDFIASIFNVDRADIISSDKRMNVVRARWMFWMALKFLLKKTNQEISSLTDLEGKFFNASSISFGINNIQSEMKNDFLLAGKWEVIKKMILPPKEIKDEDSKEEMTIKIIKPKGVILDIIEKK